MSSRAAEAFRTIPTGTVGIVGLCCSLYVVQFVVGLQLHHVTLCPRLVIYLHEYYRIITSALFHGSFMHIAMNMMSTVAISSLLEKRTGTLFHILLTMLSILLTSIVYIGFAFLLSLFGYDGILFQHSVGFSGVIFHMVVLESNLGPHISRSVFGVFSVPSFLYPWVL
jgi:membrane associated rhomboid family serine protease